MLKNFRQMLRESLGIPRISPPSVCELRHDGVEAPAVSGRIALLLKPPGTKRPTGR